MIPIPSLRCVLARSAFPLLMIMMVVCCGIHAVVASEDITYDNFNVGEFRENLGKIQPLTILPEEMRALEYALEDAIRRAQTQEVAERLRAAAGHWRARSKQFDEELEAVARQAKKDAKVRSVATFFRLVGATASVVDAIASQPTVLPDGADSETIGDTATHEEGSVQIQETHERAIRIRMNGEWQTIGVEKILYQHIAPPSDTNSPVLRNTLHRLGRLADELPLLTCNTKWGGCTAIPSFDDPEYSATAMADTLKREPSSEENDLLDIVLRLGVDLTPIGDVATLATGKDLLTGEEASRTGAGVGLAAGVIPLGKLAVKGNKLFKFFFRAGGQFFKRTVRLRAPKSIRFSQDTIKATFRNGRTIDEVAARLRSGRINPNDIPPIRLVERNGKLFTLDNRRLEAFRRAGVKVPTRMATPQEIRKEIRRKFSTKNDGISIQIRGDH